LIDRDKEQMQEVLYLLEDKMNGNCMCLEVDCICNTW